MNVELLLVPPTPSWTSKALRARLAQVVASTSADALLLWDQRLGAPPLERCGALIRHRGDVWHAGLCLGTQGQPGLMDFVAPSWMLNGDGPRDVEVTSWRVPVAAMLVRTEVFRQLGLPCDDFDTVQGALYEWGHRSIFRGAMMRHVPELVAGAPLADVDWTVESTPSLADEIRFVAYRYGRFWARWACGRAALTSYASAADVLAAYQSIPNKRPYDEPAPYRTPLEHRTPSLSAARVSVLIPTLNRARYLRVVLENLRAQTVKPHEIIIVDQSPRERRDEKISDDFADLPLVLMYQEEPGQCASRNAGLARSTGEFILFLDDDDELPPTLIEQHLRNLYRFDADVSSGVVQEIGAPPLAEQHRYVRASDVFPTGNTLIRRNILHRSGLFDLAFNRAPRADGDLGMRIFRSGAFMVLDQGLAIMHHRASEGGLRAQGARVITYRTSRETLMQRHIPHVSEIYLVSRHFSPRQKREMLWLRTFGTLSARGTPVLKFAKLLVGGVLLPDTIRKTLDRERQAAQWLETFPQIATLG